MTIVVVFQGGPCPLAASDINIMYENRLLGVRRV